MSKIDGGQEEFVPIEDFPSGESSTPEYIDSVIQGNDPPKDFAVTFTYPRIGSGALITCVRIKIVQVK